jgi:hypothetical protein
VIWEGRRELVVAGRALGGWGGRRHDWGSTRERPRAGLSDGSCDVRILFCNGEEREGGERAGVEWILANN